MSFAVVCGTILGLVAGFFGGRIDNVVMRVMDVLLAFPALLLAIAIVTARGPGLFNAVLAVSVVTIPVYARVIRSRVLSVREQDFVAADRALGVSNARILVHRVLPNSLTPLVVQATLGMATAVLELAALSFFGLAGDPDTAEWGRMLSLERNQLFTSPHLVFYPGLMIMLNVLAFNLIGDGLRDARPEAQTGAPADPVPRRRPRRRGGAGRPDGRGLLPTRGLRTWFFTSGGGQAADGVDPTVGRGEVPGLVGESGRARASPSCRSCASSTPWAHRRRRGPSTVAPADPPDAEMRTCGEPHRDDSSSRSRR